MNNMKSCKRILVDKISDVKYYLVVYFIEYIIYVVVKQKMDFYTLFPFKIELIILSGALVDYISYMEFGGSYTKNAIKGMKLGFKWSLILVIALVTEQVIAEVFMLFNIDLGILFFA